jgi:hypothetical protein
MCCTELLSDSTAFQARVTDTINSRRVTKQAWATQRISVGGALTFPIICTP